MNEHRVPQEIAFGEGAPGQSWFARMCFGTLFNAIPLPSLSLDAEAYNSMKTRGSAVDSGIMLQRWMEESPDLAFVKYDTKWIPIGPWETGTF